MRRTRVALLSLLVLLLACSPGRQEDGVLRNYVSEEAQNLDPAFAVDKASGVLVSLIYPGLFRFEPDGRTRPDLVKDWEVDAAGKRYSFTLHGDRRFDDGRRILAADVERCFTRLLDPERPSPRRWVLDRLLGAEAFREGLSPRVSGLRAPDDSTLILELTEPFSPFLGLLAMPATRIYPASPGGEPARQAGLPVCGGPWRLARWDRGDRFLLERRTPAQGRELKYLEYRIIPQPFTAVAEFEVGNLDLLRIPLAEANYWLEGKHADRILRQEELIVSYIGLNVRKPPLDDLRVRQALNYAVDVEALIRTVRVHAAERALGPVPPSLRSAPPGDIFRYRPEKSRQLLAEAGYPDGFEMEIWQKENPEVSRLLEAVQAYLSEVGVKVKIVMRDWGAFKDAVNQGSADAFFLDWLADYPDAENFLVPLFHSSNLGGGGNRAGYQDAYTDLLLDELQATAPGPARERLINGLNETIYREAPWIWLWHPVSLEVRQPGIAGYRPPIIFNGQDYLTVTRDDGLSRP